MKSLFRPVALSATLTFLAASSPIMAQPLPAGEALVDIYARHREDPGITVERLEGGLWRAQLPLAALRAQPGSMRLDGARVGEEVSFAVAPQADIQSARIILRHVSGRAQEGSRPQLRIGLNGRFVAQLDGVTERAAGVNEIILDPLDLVSGFNSMQIDAVQRYTLGCQDDDAAELWTDIDTSRSFFEVIYARRPFTGSLADLGAVVSAGVGGVEKLGIYLGSGEVNADSLRWGAIASQAVGNRLAYRLPEISRLEGFARDPGGEGGDVIAIGTPDQLAGIAPPELSFLQGEDSWLSISPSPADPSRFLIIASGRTPAAIGRALRTLSAEDFPLSATSSTIITPTEVPAGTPLPTRRPLRTDARYTFSDLGLESFSVLGQARGDVRMSFSLPAEAHFPDSSEVSLALDFAYGAGLDPTSVINILVNGVFERAIRLTNENGEVVPGYELYIPASLLRRGQNEIAFQVELSSPSKGECIATNPRHLAFTLKETSTLTLPPSSSFVQLPDLALLSETGYPFTGVGGHPMAIRAIEATPETVAGVWTLAARLGQVHGTVFLDADFGIGPDLPDANTILVGARPRLGGLLPDRRESHAMGLSGFSRNLDLADLGNNGLLLKDESPSHPGRLLMLVTAETDDQLLTSIRSLVQPSHWSQMRGGEAVWRQNPATLVTREPARTFEVGKQSPIDRMLMSGTGPAWFWIVSLAALLFLMATILAVIARYMRQRIKGK